MIVISVVFLQSPAAKFNWTDKETKLSQRKNGHKKRGKSNSHEARVIAAALAEVNCPAQVTGQRGQLSRTCHRGQLSSTGHRAEGSAIQHGSQGQRGQLSSTGHRVQLSSTGHRVQLSSTGHRGQLSSTGHRLK